MIYLYIKTHNKTGLKYLGKTTQDPFLYKGSGKIWKRHIKKHGYDVTTEILLKTDNKEELKETGLFFSKLYNVVNSEEWANLVEEYGDGGDTSQFIDYSKRKTNFSNPEFVKNREKMYLEKYGVVNHTQLPEFKSKLEQICLNKYNTTHVSKTDSVKTKISDNNKLLSQRTIVKLLKELSLRQHIPELKRGWYKKSSIFLEEIYNKYS